MFDGGREKIAQHFGQADAQLECRPVVAAMGPCQVCSCPNFDASPNSRICKCLHSYDEHGSKPA